MSKMGSHDPFGCLKHKLWPKKGSRVKLSIWLSTTKSQELPWFTYVQVAFHILLKSSQQGLQICFRPHFNQSFAQKNMGFQSCKSLNFENFKNFRTPNLRVMRQNDIWVHALWLDIKNNIRGKVMASPKFGPWWILWICVCSWLVHAPKVLKLHTHQLDIWFV
jgi:hypothetical protein